MRAGESQFSRALIAIGIIALLLVSTVPLRASSTTTGAIPRTTTPLAHLEIQSTQAKGSGSGTDPPTASCPVKGTVLRLPQTTHEGDISIGRGQTLLIANTTVTLIGNFVVDGGTLIIRNATVKGHGFPVANWKAINGACVEFTNSNDFVLDDFSLGFGSWTGLDNSTLYVNNSRMGIGLQIVGSNVTARIDRSVWENFVMASPFGPLRGSKLVVSNSVVAAVDFSFWGALNEGGSITGLKPGHISYWDLQGNETVNNVPYDVNLDNVTVIPNTLGPGPSETSVFGWAVLLASGANNAWPNVTISYSILQKLGFMHGDPLVPFNATFRDIPSTRPVNLTIQGTVKLVDTIVNGGLLVGFPTGSVTFINSESVACCWGNGTQNITLINSTATDFNPWFCSPCTINFVNSSWGVPKPADVKNIPDYTLFPNASFWASAQGFGTIWNSDIRWVGNTTFFWNYPQWQNSTVTRVFPVIVKEAEGDSASGAVVTLSTGNSTRKFLTSQNGRVDLPVVFNDQNWTKTIELDVSNTGSSFRTGLGFTTNTPILVNLGPTTSTSATSTTQRTTKASTTGGGGIPEFPYQILTVGVFAVLVIVSYLVVRRHPIRGRLESGSPMRHEQLK